MSALVSVKSLVSIVMGLALTHTIVTLANVDPSELGASGSEASKLLPLSGLSPQSALCALAVITAIIRFYHGNNQHLDRLYGGSSLGHRAKGASSVGGIGGNFLVIMVQSVFFALMSFYIDGNRILLALFTLLLLFDIVWYVANLTTTAADRETLSHQRKWMYNNLLFMVIIGGCFSANNDGIALTVGAVAILLNTLIDFKLSWSFYFPEFPRRA